MSTNTYLCILLIFFSFKLAAQSLENHKWKDRLVLIFTNSEDKKGIEKQVLEFNNCVDELNERNIEVYHITPTSYSLGLNGTNWQIGETVFERFSNKNIPFKVVLIGLDGAKKLEQNTILYCSYLNDLIDTMPMRRNELKQP